MLKRIIILCKCQTPEIEGILKDKFPAESFDDVADNYISDVISKLMNRLGVSKVGR